ncbi:MAG: N-6 DNA methylase [Promethearchaeota archaeon]
MDSDQSRRKFGQHFTSMEIFHEYIWPLIKSKLHEYLWVDLYAGEGNLLLPILEYIPEKERIEFFRHHMFLCDIQEKCVLDARKKAMAYGIPSSIVEQNIIIHDSFGHLPPSLQDPAFPIYHITNPPYLYLGYIAKHAETQAYLPLFTGDREGYQDLYQLALSYDNDHRIQSLIYIIPTNFLYGYAVSNKFRDDFLKEYSIQEAYLFEKKIFEHTGMNVGVFLFERKKTSIVEPQTFQGYKINSETHVHTFNLNPKYHYRAGAEFEVFIESYHSKNPIRLHYYLKQSEVLQNPGTENVKAIDANKYIGTAYAVLDIKVNQILADTIRSNILWVRTVDTGSWEGRAGLYEIHSSFNVDGILVTKNTYRTNPIQIFFDTPLTIPEQRLLTQYFNFILEHLRKETDSAFLTTYKYSSSNYVRKYFGLSQAKKIIATCPLLSLSPQEQKDFVSYIRQSEIEKLLILCKRYSQ